METRRGRVKVRRNINKNSPHIFLHKPIETEPKRWKTLLKSLIEHWLFTASMTLLTIYALFGDDLRLLATPKESDEIFYSISTICLFFFTLEIILGSLVKENYFLSFFFWLDLVATLSLITDIGWIWDFFLEAIQEESGSENADAADASQIARAARASRLGTRAGRIIRILRVIRLIRIVKLYKLSQEARLKNYEHRDFHRTEIVFRGCEEPEEVEVELEEFSMFSIEGSLSDSFSELNSGPATKRETFEQSLENIENEEEVEIPQESKVGKKLSEMTTRRVIMLVLGMMFGLPLFMNSFYIDLNTSYEYGLEVLDAFIDEPKNFEVAWNEYVKEHTDLNTPLVFLEVENTGYKYESQTDTDDLRNSEKLFVTMEDLDENYEFASLAIFDLRKDTQLEAGLNMLRTVFVCIVLSISSILFSHDAEIIILGPIENMIKKVKKIAKNPLQAAKDEEREEYTKQLIIQENPKFSDKHKENLETVILEKTLTKIGALLALGFGEAGSEIIAANIQSSGDVDPLIPGKRQICIFGFCDIRNFTDTTEILQETVMQFVNKIAKVVHRIVDQFSGNANKNIGDAFLLVWKFPPQAVIKTPYSIRLSEDPVISVLADMSVISFIKIIAEITTDPYISVYNTHRELERAFPGYKVKMGFGLHQGWAIEGAIGSEYKIDPSYLSPNVNMASRLEAATKQFGVPLLISEDLYEVCTIETQRQLRCIDRVTVKGSIEPISLYTCDLDTSLLAPKAFEVTENWNLKISRIIASIERDELLKEAVKGSVSISEYFEDDPDIKLMRRGSERFEKQFSKGLDAYLTGDWQYAVNQLIIAQDLKGVEDGPVQTLLEFMQSYGNKAPLNWPGYRELHDK